MIKNETSAVNPPARTISIRGNKSSYKLYPGNIIRLQSNSNYTFIYSDTHRPILIARILKDYEQMLRSFDFIRISRGSLVNKKHIDRMTADGYIIMDDQSHLKISRRKMSAVKRLVLA